MTHPRVLVVTNDFPPTLGGIQTYIRDYLGCLDPAKVVVFASTQDRDDAKAFDAAQSFTVVRWHKRIMLPTPPVARRMQQLIRENDIDVVWFGAAAPLGLLGAAAKSAGASRVIASTHGHEVGWSMFPGARQLLGIIGQRVDCLTYVSRYARNRMAAAFGPQVAWEPMPGGVDTAIFHPDDHLRSLLRERHCLGNKRVIVAVSRVVPRKGQDKLVKALPLILDKVPDAHLLIVGPGDYRHTLERRADALGVAGNVTFTGPVDFSELAGYYTAGEVFALPVRTQGGGLSVEGLGIVFLEAQACGVATVAGNGGGAPETVIDGVTGRVVDGQSTLAIAELLVELLTDDEQRRRLAAAGRDRVQQAWTWCVLGEQLRAVLSGDAQAVPPRIAWNVPE